MNCGRRVESKESEMANRKECACNEKHSQIGLSLKEAWRTVETGRMGSPSIDGPDHPLMDDL